MNLPNETAFKPCGLCGWPNYCKTAAECEEVKTVAAVFDTEVRERPVDEDPEITEAWDAQERERANEW